MKNPIALIGHAKEDLAIAKQLQSSLADLGVEVHPEQEKIRAEEFPREAVGHAVASCDLLLLLWSGPAAQASLVELEWTTALALSKIVYACLLDDTPLPQSLGAAHKIPLQNFDEGISQLRTSLRLSGFSQKEQPAALADVGTIVVGPATPNTPQGTGAFSPAPAQAVHSDLLPGQQIGTRYRIIRLLGRGGMGAVYQAFDNELDREVALKVIRADLAEDASVLQRFKREIQLSSTVTHKNVLRVYDLGESQGLKFLTMQFVEGEDLAGLFKREGRLPMERVLHIFHQMCQGLGAAHEKGILHRDLKPSNIMIDRDGLVYLTDFGLARSVSGSGLTQTGTLMGTPDYMSPEQVKGEPLDVRSDLYSLGIILYQMVTNHVPYSGDTAFEVMIQRVQKPPRPATELNPDIPPFVDKIIRRCMAIEKLARYESVEELLADLDQGMGSGRTAFGSKFLLRRFRGVIFNLTWRKAALALPLVLLLVFGGYWLWFGRNLPPAPAEPHDPVSVLIADFVNQTGDPAFGGVLEQILDTGLEGASFLTTFNRGQARKIAGQLQAGATALDENLAMLVAAREGISVILAGSISEETDRYQISVRAVDALNGQPLADETIRAGSKEEVLTAAGRLSARIRRILGDSTPESVQLAEAETFSTRSLEAARSYAQAQEIQGNGNWEEAISYYRQALDQDPEMGRALAGIAVMYRNMGQKEKAEDYYRQAMAKIDRMTDREKYRTRGGYFVTVGDYGKAIEEYSSLVEKYPADFVGYANLALAYWSSRKMAEAFEEGRRAIEIYPKSVVMRTNLTLIAMYASDFASALREAKELRKEHSFENIFVCEALSELALGNVEQAVTVYNELRSQGSTQASIAVIGLADIALYEGRFADAVEILRAGIQEDRTQGNTPAAARKAAALARALLQRGQTSSALAQAEQAAAWNSDLPVVYGAAMVFLEAGREARALELAAGQTNSLRAESRAYGKLIEGEAMLKKGKIWEAIQLFLESQQLADTWIGRLARGRAYLAAEAYPEAYSELDQCLKRRGEAAAVFLDDIPTLAALPPLYYYLGRALQGMGNPTASEHYNTFIRIKEKSEKDPLVEDAKQRAAAK